jgi:hypothetical protein
MVHVLDADLLQYPTLAAHLSANEATDVSDAHSAT